MEQSLRAPAPTSIAGRQHNRNNPTRRANRLCSGAWQSPGSSRIRSNLQGGEAEPYPFLPVTGLGGARLHGRAALRGNSLSTELDRARQYRDQAVELLRLGERVLDPQQRQVLLELAATYHRMAEQIEEIHRLDMRPSSQD
jgi:hypothetical protein